MQIGVKAQRVELVHSDHASTEGYSEESNLELFDFFALEHAEESIGKLLRIEKELNGLQIAFFASAFWNILSY